MAAANPPRRREAQRVRPPRRIRRLGERTQAARVVRESDAERLQEGREKLAG